jgi:light-regulated signal transduction histidine kinase (bacteriophytochrome)
MTGMIDNDPSSGIEFAERDIMQTDSFFKDNHELVSYLNGIKSESNPMENDFFETEEEKNSAASSPNKAGSDPPKSKEKDPSRDQDTPFMSSFLTELIHSIKNTLISIKNISQLSADKFNDVEFRKYAQKSITEDIKKIDSVLNSLLNYIHINTPIIKSNTISLVLEEVLEANEKQIQCKNIKIFKKCEKELPETFIHDQQVRFILNSVLQYAILSTPPEGTIGFLVKSFDFLDGTPGKKISPERNGGYIEAAVGFMGGQEQAERLKDVSAKSTDQKEETTKLILQLVKEILQKNRGSMTYEVDPKKPRTLITLRFPIERRKVVYYEPISL